MANAVVFHIGEFQKLNTGIFFFYTAHFECTCDILHIEPSGPTSY